MKVNVKNNVYWVGKVDWDLRFFHGYEYSTQRGSSYNSYLIQGKKNILIDTVWKPFAGEFVANLKKEIDLKEIDFIVINHGEVDHSGALPELMEHIPETPIYCTANAVKSLKGQYHKDWDFRVVKTGDKLEIDEDKELIFFEMKMLHWPDSMACYLTGENILFSNDAFGQHYATNHLFNDQVNQGELYREALKYYANILAPFSPLVTRKIKEIQELKLPIDIIATSHGVIWRDSPEQIIENYIKWADNYQEDQIVVIYDTMWEGTRQMAEYIAQGIRTVDEKSSVKLFNAAITDKNDIIYEAFRSKLILLGSPTIHRGILVSIAGLMEAFAGLGFKKKKAAAFGSYGWSGESIEILNKKILEAGWEKVSDGVSLAWVPDEEGIEKCIEFGKEVARAAKK